MDNAIAEWDRLRVSLREDFSVSLLTEFDGFLKSLASHVKTYLHIISYIISFIKGEDNRLFLLIFEMIHEHPLFLKKLGFENEMRNVLKNITNNQAKETWLSHTVLIVENLPKSLPIWPRLETGFGQTFTTVLEILGSIKMLPPNHSKTEEILDDFSTLIPWFPASGIGIDMVDEIVVKLKKLPVKFLESLFQAPSFIYQQLSTKARSRYFYI